MPVLWDAKRGTIVNNESSEILRMINDVRLSCVHVLYAGTVLTAACRSDCVLRAAVKASPARSCALSTT